MTSQPILHRIAWLHAALILTVTLCLWAFGLPVRGTLLGGGLIGFSFVAFWIFTRAIVEPRRRGLAVAVGVLKFLLYGVLGAAVLAGRLHADAAGVALGVTIFVFTTLGIALSTAAAEPAES